MDYKQRHLQSMNFSINKIKSSPVFPFVQEIILFGSCARGENKWESDVDIFVVLLPEIEKYPELRKEIRLLQGTISPTENELPEVDMKITIGNQWKNDGSFFHEQILQEGVVLYENNR